MKHFKLVGVAFCAALLSSAACAQNPAIHLQVDASDAPRGILHSKLQMPVRAGKMTLIYPKWIPGEHGPNGPITDLVGLKLAAAGKEVAWERDPEDMFAFNLEAPQGAEILDVALDFLLPPGSGAFSSAASTSEKLAVVTAAFTAMKLTVPGPLTLLQVTVTFPGGLGKPSSLALPCSETLAGNVMV